MAANIFGSVLHCLRSVVHSAQAGIRQRKRANRYTNRLRTIVSQRVRESLGGAGAAPISSNLYSTQAQWFPDKIGVRELVGALLATVDNDSSTRIESRKPYVAAIIRQIANLRDETSDAIDDAESTPANPATPPLPDQYVATQNAAALRAEGFIHWLLCGVWGATAVAIAAAETLVLGVSLLSRFEPPVPSITMLTCWATAAGIEYGLLWNVENGLNVLLSHHGHIDGYDDDANVPERVRRLHWLGLWAVFILSVLVSVIRKDALGTGDILDLA